MAKKIKFPLEMKDGNKVRTIEEFRKHFDAEKAVVYFLNGKLLGWLEDRHYDNYYKAVCEIDSKDDNLLQMICEALDVDYCTDDSTELDLKKIEKNNKKLEKIKQYVDDNRILDRLDYIAMNQKELDKLLKESCSEIYLFEKSFVLPSTISNIKIIGVNNPTVEIESDGVIDFADKNVTILGITFGSNYQKILDDYNYELEHRNDKKPHRYKPSNRLDIRLSDQDRKQSQKLFDSLEKELLDVKFDIDAGTHILYEQMDKADLYDAFDIDEIGRKQFECMKNAHLDDAFQEFESRNAN